MTTSVCLKCGKIKRGAWKSCPACGYVPAGLEDRAKQIIATDHFLSRVRLEEISERISSGQPVVFEPTQLHAVIQQIRQLDIQRLRRTYTRLLLVILALLCGAATLYLLLKRS